jgi:hypothetical protein
MVCGLVVAVWRLPFYKRLRRGLPEQKGERVAGLDFDSCSLARRRRLQLTATAILAGLTPMAATHGARAQTDEIQVYNAEIAAPGVLNLTLHDNYTPSGLKTPAFPGGVVPAQSLNGVPEFGYGVTPWWELGLYLPLYTATPNNGRFELDGFKLRTLFVSPDAADRNFFYGVNFEFSFNEKHWDPHTYTSEIRPIVGWRVGKVDFIVNPIFDNDWTGVSHLDFAPETRIAYNLSKQWAVAAEEYDDFGQIRHFSSGRQQSHDLFAVVDYTGKPLDVEFGTGFGLTSSTDHFTLKLILSHDF